MSLEIKEDRLNFIKRIDLPDSLENCIRQYFDQLMCMYNITQYIPISDITMESDGTIVKFSLGYHTERDINEAEFHISRISKVEIYGSLFILTYTRDGNILNITLTR